MWIDHLRRFISPKYFATLYRLMVNFWPCIRGTGGRVIYISQDFTELVVRLKLSWRTRNLVGTVFGGSMYSSTDPMFMLMLIEILGKDFVVWDKGCTIRFRKPAKVPIFAQFKITPEMLKDVHDNVAQLNEYTFTWKVEFKDEGGTSYCELDKVLYVAKKSFYKQKLLARANASKP